MSLLFDAIGHDALAHPRGGVSYALAAGTGAFILTGKSASFAISEAVVAGVFALTGVVVSFAIKETAAAGAYALTGIATNFSFALQGAAGAYIFTGNAAPLLHCPPHWATEGDDQLGGWGSIAGPPVTAWQDAGAVANSSWIAGSAISLDPWVTVPSTPSSSPWGTPASNIPDCESV